jgi:hypothetical protein
MQNTIVGNTVIANVTYDQGIHINGELNVVVDNTVLMLDGVTPVSIRHVCISSHIYKTCLLETNATPHSPCAYFFFNPIQQNQSLTCIHLSTKTSSGHTKSTIE